MGQKQKTEKIEREKKTKVGDNNGLATHGARKHAWRTQAAWANYFEGPASYAFHMDSFYKYKKTNFRHCLNGDHDAIS